MWNTLAPELILEILRHFLPGLKLMVSRSHLYPWHLGHICTTWRSVFVSSPEFWRIFHVDLIEISDRKNDDTPNLGKYERALEMVTMYIQRSDGHPISFCFKMPRHRLSPGTTQSPALSLCLDILITLVAHSAHWQDVHIQLDRTDLPILNGIRGKLPLLRSIKLMSSDWAALLGYLGNSAPSLDSFSIAPRLSRAFVSRISVWNLDFSTLTVLHIDNPPAPGDLIGYLRRTERLEELSIQGQFRSIIAPHVVAPVNLPLLKVLRVETPDALLLFEAPSLQELCLRSRYIKYCVDVVSFNTAVTQFFSSPQHLKKLSATLSHIEPEDITLFHRMPIVQELSLYDHRANHLKLLAESATAPHVTKLTVGFWDSHNKEALFDLSKAIKTWKRSDNMTGGIGSFKSLTLFSLIINWELLSDIDSILLNGISCHFQEQGMPYSIQLCDRRINDHPDFPPFVTV